MSNAAYLLLRAHALCSRLQMLVGELVRLLLLKQRDKLAVTVADINKTVLGDNYKGVWVFELLLSVKYLLMTCGFMWCEQMKLGSELIKRATDICHNVFGFKVVVSGALQFAALCEPLHVCICNPTATPRTYSHVTARRQEERALFSRQRDSPA